MKLNNDDPNRDKMSAKQYQEWAQKKEAAKTSRYKGIPTQTADGQKFRSHVEAHYYNRCLILQKTGEIVLIEREVRYELVVNGVFVCTYFLDFRITYKDDRVEHVDTKSEATLTPIYRIKKQLMLACHGIELIEVFE